MDELDARREAAQAAFPEPPSVRIGNRNDRLNRNQGSNEWEAELALSLWLPGERARRAAVVAAQDDQYGSSLTAAKLRIAGEVREAYDVSLQAFERICAKQPAIHESRHARCHYDARASAREQLFPHSSSIGFGNCEAWPEHLR